MNNPSEPKEPSELSKKLRAGEIAFHSQVNKVQSQSSHPSTQGSKIENLWINFLREYLPSRYRIERGFVSDSEGNVSQQIDCIIYDALYTPRLYGDEDNLCVPAESVYAIFESKPSVSKENIEYACDKANSVRKLHRKNSPVVVDRGEKHASREPFRIIGGLLATSMDIKTKTIEEHFGIFDLDCILVSDNENPSYWDKFEGIASNTGKCSLIAGVFRLLHKLQTIGTVAPIDWKAYEGAIINE